METWRDIVAELKAEPISKEGAKPWLHYIADRIEAACKTLEDLLIVEQEENDRLRRELETITKRSARARAVGRHPRNHETSQPLKQSPNSDTLHF